jgi:hypothetical protein
MAHCFQCRLFIANANSWQGAGKCGAIEDFKKRGASPRQIEAAEKRCGGAPFWGGDDMYYVRNCEKFEVKL